jgi:hypothetical protein
MIRTLTGFLILAGTSITYKVMLFMGNTEFHEVALATAISGAAAIGLYEHFSEIIKGNKDE